MIEEGGSAQRIHQGGDRDEEFCEGRANWTLSSVLSEISISGHRSTGWTNH